MKTSDIPLTQLVHLCLPNSLRIRLSLVLTAIAATTTQQASADSLLVGDHAGGGVIRRYDSATGAYLGVFASGGGLTSPSGLVWGPDGNLYVADYNSGRVLRYNGRTGAFIGVFATAPAYRYIVDLSFAANTNLYVALDDGSVHSVNGTNGTWLGQFIPPYYGGAGGIMASGNSVFLTLGGFNGVGGQLLYYGQAGDLLLNVYSDFSGNGPRSPRRGPDSNIYVPDWQTPHVVKIHGYYLGFIGNIVDDNLHRYPIALAFSSDGGMFVLEDDGMASSINRYTLATGAFETQLVAAGSGGLGRAGCLLLMRDPPPLVVAGASYNAGIEQIQLRWTNNGAPCVLETTTALLGGWTSINPPLTTNANWISATILSEDSARFFRLR